MIKKSLLSLVFLVFSSPAFATDYTAASCENKAGKLDVQTAVNAASAAGDRVLIPAGTCTWTVGLGINKAITLQGAGVGRTLLRNGTMNGGMIEWYLVHGKDQRLTGIEFNMNGGGNPNPNGTLTIIGDRDVTTRFRLDHNKFDRLSAFAVVPMMVRGVFDHNEFIFVDSTTPVYVYDDG